MLGDPCGYSKIRADVGRSTQIFENPSGFRISVQLSKNPDSSSEILKDRSLRLARKAQPCASWSSRMTRIDEKRSHTPCSNPGRASSRQGSDCRNCFQLSQIGSTGTAGSPNRLRRQVSLATFSSRGASSRVRVEDFVALGSVSRFAEQRREFLSRRPDLQPLPEKIQDPVHS
jgi:hypothetical protein